ncbi:hypothetical protein B0H11DRAFT_2185930 [Mycena galericulata]|nr:hypothetical protein B0H11DRAFT_2185930 [Mycena galericulata]
MYPEILHGRRTSRSRSGYTFKKSPTLKDRALHSRLHTSFTRASTTQVVSLAMPRRTLLVMSASSSLWHKLPSIFRTKEGIVEVGIYMYHTPVALKAIDILSTKFDARAIHFADTLPDDVHTPTPPTVPRG